MNADLEQAQALVATLQAAVREAERAGRSQAETRATLRTWLDHLHERGGRQMRRLVMMAAADGRVDPEPLAGLDAMMLMCTLLGPAEVVKRLDPFVRALPDGPTATGRAERLADLRAQLFAAELAEERVVMALEGAGQIVQRRVDADPAAVLALQAEAAA